MIPVNLLQPKEIDFETNQEVFGIWICGAPLGEDGYVKTKLHQVQLDLCGTEDIEGSLVTLVKKILKKDAHVAHHVLRQSVLSRVDYLLATSLPSQTQALAKAMDRVLELICTLTYDCNVLDPGGHVEGSVDSTFVRDRVQRKVSQGGGGIRLVTPRAMYLNAMSLALQIFRQIWPSLISIFGETSFASVDGVDRWTAFYDTGSVYALELKGEWLRLQQLRLHLLIDLAPVVEPESPLQVSVNNFGFGIDKLHKKRFDSLGLLKSALLSIRARQLSLDDPRGAAYLEALPRKIAKQLIGASPNLFIILTSEEFQAALQNYMGVPLSCCKPVLGHYIPTNHSMDKELRVDAFGKNIARSRMNGGGILEVHNSIVNGLVSLLKEAGIPNSIGKDVFSDIVTRMDVEERVKQGIIPDIVINLGTLAGTGNEAKKLFGARKTLTDVKTLSPGGTNVGENILEKRQTKVHLDYRKHASDLDNELEVPEGVVGPVTQRLMEFGINGEVMGLVLGPYGEFSSHVYSLVELLAGQKMIDHNQYYEGDRKKVAAMFRLRMYQYLSFLGHRAWARLRLDRIRRVKGVANPGFQHNTSQEEVELSVMREFAFNHPERSGSNIFGV